VRLGFVESPPARVHGPAYARALDLADDCAGVRVVTAHLALEQEVRDFLTDVATRLPARDAPIAGPLARMSAASPRLAPDEVAALRARFGPPFHASERLLAWEVPCRAGSR
jgi:hypothetical protein